MKVLLFDPYSDVWVHSFPASLVAETLAQHGHEVHAMRCDGVLNEFCIAMSARGNTPTLSAAERHEACQSCRKRRQVLDEAFPFSTHLLESWLESEDFTRVNDLLSTLQPNDWTDLCVDELPIGRIAAYEFFLTYKLNSHDIPSELWPIYGKFLRNSLLVFFAIRRMFSSLAFDAILVYNGLYSTNRLVSQLAAARGIPSWAMHAGGHVVDKFSTICLYQSDLLPVLSYNTQEWHEVRSRPLTGREIVRVKNHVAEILRGRNVFVYSSAVEGRSGADIRQHFGIEVDQKVLLVTLSSGDEIVAARLAGLFPEGQVGDQMFTDSAQWIRFLIDEVVDRPDLFLLIRVHPREFPNKREGQRSQNSFLLEQVLQDLPSNAAVNWPEQQISLYDLIDAVDVVLNSTSSAGLELSAFGLPVVLHDTQYMLSYDPQIHRVVTSRRDYMTAVDGALTAGRSIENSRNAFRWWSFMFSHVAVSIEEGFSYPASGYTLPATKWWNKLYNKLLKLAARLAPPIKERSDIRQRKPLRLGHLFNQVVVEGRDFAITPQPSGSASLNDETAALNESLEELRNLLHAGLPGGSK